MELNKIKWKSSICWEQEQKSLMGLVTIRQMKGITPKKRIAAELINTQKNGHRLIPLIQNIWNGKIHRDRKLKGYQSLEKGRDGQFLPNGHKNFVWGYVEVVEVDNGNGCTTLWKSLIVEMANFITHMDANSKITHS